MRLPEDGVKGEEGKKCLEEEDEEEGCTNIPKHPTPPDGGWGWLVVLASFLCNMIVDGVCFSFGVVAPEYIKAFGASHAKVGWVGSSLAGGYLLVGPFVSAMCQRYGCRRVTIIGSIVTMVGFALSTQSSNLEMLIVTYGIIGGIGFGMIYLPSIVCVGHWFDKKRAFTTGIAVCGSGLGQFVFPPLASYLLTEYTWEGKNLIMAGIALNCAVCGMLFLPLDRRTVKRRKPIHSKVEIERGAIMKALIEDKKRQRTISNGSLDNCIITRDNRLIKLDPRIFECKRNNSFIARFKRQLGFSSTSLACSKNSLQGIPSIVIDAVQKDLNKTNGSPIYRPNGTKVQHLSQQQLVQKRGSLPDGYVLPPANGVIVDGTIPIVNGSVLANGVAKTRSCDTIPKDDNNPWLRLSEGEPIPLNLEQLCGIPSVTRSANDLPSTPIPPSSIEGSVISIQVIPNGCERFNSVRSVRYRSNRSMVSGCSSRMGSSQASYVTNSVISVPQFQASLEELELEIERQHSMFCKCWRILCDMFVIKLMFNPVFALLVFSTFVTLLAFYIPYFFLPLKGEMIGMSLEASSFLISIVGITNTVGRLMCGWIADRPWANTLHLNNGALIFAGIAILACPWCDTQTSLAIIAAVFGLCGAVFVSLRSVLLVDLLGLEMLTKSFGLLILFQGVAAFIGAPIAGRLFDTTGSVDNCFYMAGGLTIISGLLMMPIVCLRKDETNKKLAPLMPEATPITETLKLENIESQI